MNPGLLVSFWLLGNLFLVGVYDLYSFFFLPPGNSVSFFFQKWMQEFPVLAVCLGILIGHLAWPLHTNRGE